MPTKDKTEQREDNKYMKCRSCSPQAPIVSEKFHCYFQLCLFKVNYINIPRGGSSQQISFDSHHHWHCDALVVKTLCPLTASVPVPRQVLKHSYFRISGLSVYPLHIITSKLGSARS